MTFEIERLDHVALTVSDMDRSIDWYREVLGLEHALQDEWGRNPAFLSKGSSGVALFPARPGAAPPPRSHPENLAMWHLAFRTDRANFDGAQRDLDSREIEFTFSDHGVSHSVYFHDPDGHLIEITTYDL